MACPSGCLNGGAQIPLKNNNNNNKNDKLSAKKLLTLVSDVYHEQEERWGGEGEGEKVGEGEGGRLGEVYEWAGGKVGSGFVTFFSLIFLSFFFDIFISDIFFFFSFFSGRRLSFFTPNTITSHKKTQRMLLPLNGNE